MSTCLHICINTYTYMYYLLNGVILQCKNVFVPSTYKGCFYHGHATRLVNKHQLLYIHTTHVHTYNTRMKLLKYTIVHKHTEVHILHNLHNLPTKTILHNIPTWISHIPTPTQIFYRNTPTHNYPTEIHEHTTILQKYTYTQLSYRNTPTLNHPTEIH